MDRAVEFLPFRATGRLVVHKGLTSLHDQATMVVASQKLGLVAVGCPKCILLLRSQVIYTLGNQCATENRTFSLEDIVAQVSLIAL